MKTENSTQEFTPDNLFAGGFPIVTASLLLEKGQQLSRGSIVVEKKYGRYELIKKDTPGTSAMHILAEDVDTTDGHVQATVYQSGEFRERSIIVGEGVVVSTIRDTLRIYNIYLKESTTPS